MPDSDERKIVFVEESQFSITDGGDLDEDVRDLLRREISSIPYVRSVVLELKDGNYAIVVTPNQPELIETARGATIDLLRSLSSELGIKVVRREVL